MLLGDFYSFDTSAILNGRRDLYFPTKFKGMWAGVAQMITDGQVRAVEIVKDELAKMDDEPYQWAKDQEHLFHKLTREVQLATKDILRQHAKLVGVGGKRNGADPFVIALAMVYGGKVVSQETPGSMKSPRIPNVCEALNIECISLGKFIDEMPGAW